MTQQRKTAGGRGGDIRLLERPLSARSLVASLLLGMQPPRRAGRRLVQWCALFGVAEGTARVALSRMVERGELTTSAGVYELAGPIRRRQPAQDWSVAPAPSEWDGEWLLAVVAAGSRAADDRAAMRDAGRRLRMVELRDGVWTRPANLPRAASPADAWQTADSQCTWWSARPDRAGAADALALFAPKEWAERARQLRDRLVTATATLAHADGAALADAFVVGAAAVAHVRADPLLPAELCARNWPGDALRSAYREYQDAFSGAIREWFRAR